MEWKTHKLHIGSEEPDETNPWREAGSLRRAGGTLRHRRDLGVGAPRAIGLAVPNAPYACTEISPSR